ncbi:MAG: glycerate kinase [Clostridiales bacterium]|jgi:glycerate kinase|nr:glycerate kinase [Clostridiales bacterium]
MKKIVVAMDSFKGCLSSADAGGSVARGVARALPDAAITVLPVADGGEGTLDALKVRAAYREYSAPVTAPDGRAITARFLSDGKSAVVEMALASGLTLTPEGERDAVAATSYGAGELLLAAARTGARKILLCIGGSATTDGGLGLAAALGIRFLDAGGARVFYARDMEKIVRADLSEKTELLDGVTVEIACDVTNPLCGPKGAARVYGSQKGASPMQVELLDRGLGRLNEAVRAAAGSDFGALPGAGAAGGVSVPLAAFFGARLRSGIVLVLETLEFDKSIRDADWVVAGEGRVDNQSAQGKALSGIGKRAAAAGVPVLAIAGRLGAGYESVYERGVRGIFAIQNKPMSAEESIAAAPELLADCAERIFRLLYG